MSKEEKINSAKKLCWILAKNKANFEFNAARCAINLTRFCDKRQAIFALVILDALQRLFLKKLPLCIFLLFGLNTVFAQSFHGLYVDKFYDILGNKKLEDSLLSYVKKNKITYLALYELSCIDFRDIQQVNVLAAFIRRAKTQYGVKEIGATGEVFSFFRDDIHFYNQKHSNKMERFDVYSFEFEYWVPHFSPLLVTLVSKSLKKKLKTCNRKDAFQYYIKNIKQIDSLAHADNVKTELEFGWFTELELKKFLPYADRIFISAFLPNPSDAFVYTTDRLKMLAANVTTKYNPDVVILFSAEQDFMKPWLAQNKENTLLKAFTIYANDWKKDKEPWRNKLNLVGYQWFNYHQMPFLIK